MKTSMEKTNTTQDLSSKKQFHWRTTKVSIEDDQVDELVTFNSSLLNINSSNEDHEKEKNKVVVLDDVPTLKTSLTTIHEEDKKLENDHHHDHQSAVAAAAAASAHHVTSRRKLQVAVSRLRFVLAAFSRNRAVHFQQGGGGGLGSRVVGTLFGYRRRGHVHFAFHKDSNSPPVLLVELATPITGLVKEMASGLVRIALECDKVKDQEKKATTTRLLEEPLWRAYCNGKKCGFATRRECGQKELKIFKAVEPISMGAGVLPAGSDDSDHGDIMYMRAKFERVVGSRDSEAFYMMNPDSNGAPELSIYLLRV